MCFFQLPIGFMFAIPAMPDAISHRICRVKTVRVEWMVIAEGKPGSAARIGSNGLRMKK
jgi:hypothetical protein